MNGNVDERRAAIKEIIKNEEIIKQEHIVSALESNYNILTDQGTVSNDLRRLNIKKDKESGVYKLSPHLEKKQAKRELNTLISTANCEADYENSYLPIFFKCDPKYVHTVAASLEEYFSTNEDIVTAVANHTGTIVLYIPELKYDSIKEELDSIYID